MLKFFERFRRDPGLPMNDAWTLFWWTTIAEVLVAIAATLAAFDYSPFRLAGFEVLAVLFVSLHFFGSTYGAIYYPDRHRLESLRMASPDATKSLFRRGEIYNALFTGYVGLVIPLLIMWNVLAVNAPSSTFLVAETSVGILTSFSIVKLIRVPSVLRRIHNSVLFWLAMAATMVSAVMLVSETFFGRGPMDSGVLDLYTVILLSYATHSTAFSLLCPQFKTRRPGHLVGFNFVLIVMAIAFMYTFGIGANLPDTLMQFGIRTGAIMLIGFALSYYFRSPAKEWREKKDALNADEVSAQNNDDTAPQDVASD